ncbi:nephrin isoform X2 [Halyomorpha halys]|uniref:nephrin isoform X2 n=1 Tax=Halyomorpha halys TaxID=286706 RepID=UPI0006D4DCFB|nr:nephrin [Halyomorpha halys]
MWTFSAYFVLFAVSAVRPAKEIPVLNIEAVAGDPVYLPCDISPRQAEGQSPDSVQLVLWYREDIITPIYSVDARERSWKEAVKWSSDQVFGNRAYFMPEKKPAELGVDHVRESDAGVYRCRVDFSIAQTRFSRINLTVIVPPTKMTIVDENDAEKNNIVGPYEEGSDLNLRCQVYGGKPRPTVAWYRGEELLTNYSSPGNIGVPHTMSLLVINNLGRADLRSELTCVASNNNKTIPLTSTVQIDMNFKPLEVKIQDSNQPLSAGRLYNLPCTSTGSRPPAQLTWWKGGHRLDKTKETTANDGNRTTSTLSFIPSKEDDGQNLTCKAENPSITGTPPISDYWTLHIQYVPETKISLGTSLKADEIREGNDVYFDCKVKAVPPVYKIEWRHNGRLLSHNIGQRVVISDKSLALQGVSRNNAGNYTCVGFNTEGDGESTPFYLDVMYAPTCKPLQTRVHGVAKQERVNITCEVDANPPEVTYRWTFNNSAEGMVTAPERIIRHGASSPIATYTPVSDLDYGTLLCWAANRIGNQKVPCVFHIIAAGKPDQVHNCSLSNSSKVSFSIRCQEGFNGGLPQSFLLEVTEPSSTKIVWNMTSAVPRWTVYGLQPGINYEALVYSVNGKGRSEPMVLQAPTMRLPEKQLTAERERPRSGFKMTPVLTVVSGVVGSLFLVACLVAGLLRLQCSRDDRPRAKADPPPAKPLASSPKGDPPSEPDERNPDIIPQPNSGLEEEEHEFMRKRQLVSTIETRTSPSRSLLQPGPYPGYCTLRNGGLPLQDLSNIPTKPQVSGEAMYPTVGCTLPRHWGGVRGPPRGIQVLPPAEVGPSQESGPGTPLMAAKRESQV